MPNCWYLIYSQVKKYGNWKEEKLTEAWKEYKKSKQNAKGKETEGMCKRFKCAAPARAD